MTFSHLHVHSCFSPGWGVHTPEELCQAARKLGMTHLALTDRNGLYALPRFLAAAREAGIKPLVGAEVVSGGERAVLLARDQTGYANLCRLLSERHCAEAFSLAEALDRWRGGLTILSDDPDLLSTLARQMRNGLYVELSPGHQMHRALQVARRLRLPPVATSRVVGLDEKALPLHRVLYAIAGNTTLTHLNPATLAQEADLLWSSPRMADFFPHCPAALENALQIATSCCSAWDLSATVFPQYRDWNDQRALDVLQERARQGALKRYGRIDARIETRLAKELSLVAAKGFAHYFLVVEELATRSPRTCGRGSAAASLIAYCLGITHVDPLRYNLFFERFLNEGRSDPPDIDIDFPWDERDAILDFAFARYGARRTAMVANQIGFKGRSALREVAKVFGIPAQEIGNVTRRISGYWRADHTAGAVRSHPLFSDTPLPAPWPEIIRIASRLRDHLRHLSLHCGGLVIVPDEIRRHVPVQLTAKGLPAIQWDKDQAEAAGLVKIDLLGNRSLAVIRDALAAVAENTGHQIDYASWQPLHDARTRELLARGETMGCFYIESPATRQLLRRMWGPGTGAGLDPDQLFEHLVMASSIIRPAANSFILEFVARMHGKPWEPLHPLLKPVLDETYGIAVYQEQITQLAMSLAGFSAQEGDQLRKIICNKLKGKRLTDLQRRFFTGGRERGLADSVLEQVWGQMLSFGGYSFCKPHSASYALVSAKSAWLKTRYPAEFMAAVISNQGGFYSPFAYLSECRRMGLEILPPDINASFWQYQGSGRQVRVGFMQISGLRREEVRKLLEERERVGEFRDFPDFLRRVELSPAASRQLVRAGCFDNLHGAGQRSQLLWQILDRSIAENNSLLPPVCAAPPALGAYRVADLQAQERETLHLALCEHPLAPFRAAMRRAGTIPAADLGNRDGQNVALAGWWITGKTVQTKHDQPMEFITFEDETALFDTTFFPSAYRRFCRLFGLQRPYLIKGRVETVFGVATLNVSWLGLLDS